MSRVTCESLFHFRPVSASPPLPPPNRTRYLPRAFRQFRFETLTNSGPINTLAVHPQGKAYASGAEDGFVRVHWVGRRSFIYMMARGIELTIV